MFWLCYLFIYLFITLLVCKSSRVSWRVTFRRNLDFSFILYLSDYFLYGNIQTTFTHTFASKAWGRRWRQWPFIVQWLKPLRNAICKKRVIICLSVSLLTTNVQDISLRSEIIKISLIFVSEFFVAKQLEFATGHDSYEDTCSINIQSFTPRGRFWECIHFWSSHAAWF